MRMDARGGARGQGPEMSAEPEPVDVPGPGQEPMEVDARAASEAWESLFRAQVTVMRRLQADRIWDELSMREYDVLFTLSRAPGQRLRLRDLNRSILLSQPSLSRLVERLEQGGLVERCAAVEDARGTTVRLTAGGAALQRRVGRRHVRTIHRYVAGALSAGELATLTRLTEKLRSAQADIPEEPAGPRVAASGLGKDVHDARDGGHPGRGG